MACQSSDFDFDFDYFFFFYSFALATVRNKLVKQGKAQLN